MNTRHQTVYRIVAAVSTAAVLVVGLGAPAHAAVDYAGANGCSGLHCYTAVLTVDLQPVPNSIEVQVVWYCEATGTVDPASTSITQCSVNGVQALPVSLPGPFAATGSTGSWPRGAKLITCVEGYSTFVEVVLGTMTVGGSSCARLTIPKVTIEGGGPG
jgi:hypothetical protein